MYELHLKGKTIVELKKAVEDAAAELNGFTGTTRNIAIEKKIALTQEQFEANEGFNEPEVDEEYIDESQIGAGLVTDAGTHAGLELDSEGLPWDKRIHSSSKNKNADGSWRIRKGVDKDLVNKVKIELRGSAIGSSHQAPVVPTVQHVEVPTAQPVYQQPVVVEQPVITPPVQTQSAAAPAPIAAPPMPTMTSGHTLDSFKANFPHVIAQLITEKKITQDYVNILKDHYKVDQIWNVNDVQKEEMFHGFVQYGFIQKVG